jgi:hypothetical protein
VVEGQMNHQSATKQIDRGTCRTCKANSVDTIESSLWSVRLVQYNGDPEKEEREKERERQKTTVNYYGTTVKSRTAKVTPYGVEVQQSGSRVGQTIDSSFDTLSTPS